MTQSSASNASCRSGAGQRSWLGGRTGFLLGAAALGGAALWFGWPWLVVAGIVPILVAFAPCLIMCGAMCAFGMCKKKQTATPAGSDASSTVVALSGSEPAAPARPEVGPEPVAASEAENRMPA